MKDFERWEEVVDSSHETLEEDNFGEAEAEAVQIAGKAGQVREVI